MKIVHLMAHASYRSGGPFDSVYGLARDLMRHGVEASIVALRDKQSADATSDRTEVPYRLCARFGPRTFAYSPGYAALVAQEGADLLHVHGLWAYPSIVALRWSRQNPLPHVIAPRGMLDPWALQNSRWKKRVAGWLYENANLRRAACLHALTASEAMAIRSRGLTNPIAVVPNGITLPAEIERLAPDWRRALPADARVLLFLGRIHPKKGIGELIEGWSRVRHNAERDGWHLAIAGWEDGGQLRALRARANALGLGRSVAFIGAQHGPDKAATFANADAFVLPSFSEGLPLAVLEAWSHRLPVLMSEACNLPDGFSVGAAIAAGPEVSAIADGLTTLFALSDHERRMMGDRGRELVRSQFTWASAGQSMSQVYRWLLHGGTAPACVIVN